MSECCKSIIYSVTLICWGSHTHFVNFNHIIGLISIVRSECLHNFFFFILDFKHKPNMSFCKQYNRLSSKIYIIFYTMTNFCRPIKFNALRCCHFSSHWTFSVQSILTTTEHKNSRHNCEWKIIWNTHNK